MAFSRWNSFFTAAILICSSLPVVRSQWNQDYDRRLQNGITNYFYYPTTFQLPQQVVNLGNERVILYYNCYYMRDICENSRAWYATPRGQNPHPNSQLPNYVFGYDYNSGRAYSSRASQRGAHTCPSSWKNNHACPEQTQHLPMRNDGQWISSRLEPGTTINGIENERDANGQITRYSRMRYTCDEFPPKTWVEGGDDVDRSHPASTRCAAFRCGPGTKAEQNWQATSHLVLRNKLTNITTTRRRTSNGAEFSWFSNRNSVALFGFGTYNGPDGAAARVITYRDDPTVTTLTGSFPVTQAKRDFPDNNSTITETEYIWPDELNHADIMKLVKAGHAEETVISAHSYVPETGNHTDTDFDWEYDEEIDGVNDGPEMEDSPRVSTREMSMEQTRAQPVMRSVHETAFTPLLKRSTPQDLQSAQSIVDSAIEESSKLNLARLAKPLRNTYGLKPETIFGGNSATQLPVTENQDVTPLLEVTDRIAEAAALVAEGSASSIIGNYTKRAVAPTGSYWMGSITRRGTVPWGNDPAYKVFRNVIDYGAVGDGITDDTKAINAAMGNTNGTDARCGKGCNGSTTKNAIVYFPPGNYLISTTIAMPFGTQVIGDANTRPTLVAAPKFVGLGVLSTDEYTGGPDNSDGSSQEYYINTANFYRQIRNVVVDITKVTAPGMACIHYQVAQATSMQNVELKASASSGGIGIFAENGSGGQISDVTFTGGAFGIFGGNQQFTAQRLVFNGCTVGVQVIWDWGWVWKSISMTGVGTGFKLLPNGTDTGNIGSISVLDSSFKNVGTAVLIAPPSSTVGSGSTGLVLENVALSGVTAAVADSSGKVILAGSAALIDQWALGPTYEGSVTARTFSAGAKVGNYQRHSTLLDSTGAYFERAKPQYEKLGVDQFVSVKAIGAKGDGVNDDTAAFQAALYASLGKVLFVDAGSYILTSTIIIPNGAKIVGETWSQLVASGAYFKDASNPKVLIKVGNVGDIGNVEMQDLIFTTRGATAGLILVEWNIQAEKAGSAGLWDCHARIGGATGTELTPAECPASTSGINAGCSAASLMFHLTSKASGYFENMWLWGADHMLDDPDLVSANNDMVQCSIYIARGFLIESTHATWMYGTASEHAVFYQYNFHAASNIFAGMIQTESPYFQPTPKPPAPFAAVVGQFIGDPKYTCTAGDFSGCDESWAVIIESSSNIFIAGAGLYSWFSTYAQTCIDTQACQKTLMFLDSNGPNVRVQNLITIGAQYMAVMNGVGITAAKNLNVNEHPFWSQVSILDVQSKTNQFEELIWIDPKIWKMEQPAFTCIPPCYIMIPPWTGATSTVNYPLITVSDGSWTSTITKAPITVSEYVFEVVTITAGSAGKAKRDGQGFSPFWPTPATTPSWPSVVYAGIDGQSTTTAPSGPFPTPPPSIGPDTPDPPIGSWPKRFIEPYLGPSNEPKVNACDYYGLMCITDPYLYPGGVAPYFPDEGGDGDDDYDENWEDATITCPTSTSTSTTSSTISTTIDTPEPTASPYQEGNPGDNEVACYDGGAKTESVRMIAASKDFCNEMKGDTFEPGYVHTGSYPFPYNGGFMSIKIDIQFSIPKVNTLLGRDLANAQLYSWEYDFDECMKYLAVPRDSCNCGGVNNKQGGVVTNKGMYWRLDPNLY